MLTLTSIFLVILKKFMKIGLKLFLIYIGIYYVLPLLLGPIYDFSYMDIFIGEVSHSNASIGIALFSFIFLLIYLCGERVNFLNLEKKINIFGFEKVNLLLSMIFLFLAFYFQYKHGISYRQKGRPISEVANVIMPLMILRLYFNAVGISYVGRLARKDRFSRFESNTLFLIALSLTVSSTSAYGVVRGLIFFFIFLEVKGLRGFLFCRSNKVSLIGQLKSVIFLFAVGVSGFLMGLANKWGIERAIESTLDLPFKKFLVIPLRRLSYHYYSFAHSVENNLLNLDFQNLGLDSSLDMLWSRAMFLFGAKISKGEVWSPSRLNIITILNDYGPRTGASPGMLSSANFFPLFPINYILWIVFLSIVFHFLSTVVSGERKPKFLTFILLLLYAQSIVDSSIEFLNPMSNAGISLLFLLFLRLSVRPYKNTVNVRI
ncbi:MAG: hypothetical protein CME63_14650 [Halobacteriovoraceae bacterium]|nr:hypothetical protein [Halobacteriovoraceae bacterium]